MKSLSRNHSYNSCSNPRKKSFENLWEKSRTELLRKSREERRQELWIVDQPREKVATTSEKHPGRNSFRNPGLKLERNFFGCFWRKLRGNSGKNLARDSGISCGSYPGKKSCMIPLKNYRNWIGRNSGILEDFQGEILEKKLLESWKNASRNL